MKSAATWIDVPLRVALVGCGVVGQRRAGVLRSRQDSVLRLAVDRDPERAQRIAGTLGCEVVRDWRTAVCRSDIDAVIVSTTPDVLTPITIAALEHGKHVLVEKPMARTPAEAETIVRAAERQDTARPATVLKVGFNHRFHPALQEAHAALSRGDIGDPLFIRCRYGHGGRPGYEAEWRLAAEISGGGELLDQGVHALDLFRWFLGEFAEAVGFTATFFWTPPGDRPATPRLEDNAFGLLRTSRGQVASLHVSWTQWRNLFSFEVFGREGYLIVDGLGGSYGVERLIHGRRTEAAGPPAEWSRDFGPPDRSWEREWEEFLTAIREQRQPCGDGRDGWEALKMAHAIYESQRTGRPVRLAEASAAQS